MRRKKAPERIQIHYRKETAQLQQECCGVVVVVTSRRRPVVVLWLDMQKKSLLRLMPEHTAGSCFQHSERYKKSSPEN